MEGLVFAARTVAKIVLYACVFALLFVPGVFLTVWIVGQQGSLLFWPLLVVGTFYWILAILAGVKVHTALSVWLNRRSARLGAKRMIST
jgi:hypothetical protein